MMSEEKELTTPELSNSSVQKRIQKILKHNSSLSSQHVQELETDLTALAALPFKDEIQQENFLEQVQRLQGCHIIQIFNLGVAPFENSLAQSSVGFLEEVNKLVDICISFCYTSDVSKRVAFEYYMRALKFCFPSDPKQCLSTEVVYKLLKLVQIFQEGMFSELGEVKQGANSKLQIYGTNYFFAKLLQIFESRRQDNSLVEIIDQTIRLASADAEIKCTQEHTIGNAIWRSEHMVTPVFLTDWMKLLTLPNVSNGFAVTLAKVDSLRCTQQVMPLVLGSVVFQISNLTYKSAIRHCLRVLEEIRTNGSEKTIPYDKERLDIFFNYFNHFCINPNVTAASLKLLATTSVSNNVLREVLDLLFCKEGGDAFQKAIACDLAFKILPLLPDGELVRRVLKFWKEAFSDNPSYQILACLLAFFAEESNSESAGRTLEFLKWLPRPLLLLIPFWQEFLLWFIKLFPTTFQRRPEALVFIHKATLVARVPAKLRQDFFYSERLPTLQLLEWLSQQSCTEEMKTEMIWLLMCSRDIAVSFNKEFDMGVIKTLSLCPGLPFNTKKRVFIEITNLATFFKDSERKYFLEFIAELTSNQTLELMDEILLEFLDFIKRFVDRQRPKNIPVDILTHLSSLSSVSVSGARKMKVMQLLKKSGKGLLSGSCILHLITNHQCVLKERTNEYFDVLFPAIVETLEERNYLCKQLDNQALGCYFPSVDVLKVWTFVAAGLISLGLYKEEIDLQCCRPVLQHAWGFDSPFEILKLISLVRLTAVRLARLSRGRTEVQNTSQENSPGETNLPEKYTTAVRIILDPEVLSTYEKLLLVKKMSDVVLSKPHTLSAINMKSALSNLIPSSLGLQSTSSSIEGIHLQFNCIVSLLDDPKMLNQLSRISEDHNIGSLCSILSTKMSDSFSEVHLVNIFYFISSQQDLDQAFFKHLVPFVKVATQESTSLEDVLEYLKELVEVLRCIRSELIPLTMSSFGYLLKNHVDKHERSKFLTEVAKRWKLKLNHRILSFMDVPQILWKVYNTASTPAKRYELMDRAEEILRKNSYVEQWAMKKSLLFERPQDYITRRIVCCELEWLVFHSLLPSEEACLAFDMSCLSFQLSYQRLRCLKFSDVQIEDGFFKFESQENETRSDIPENDIGTAPSVAVATTGNVSPATEEQNPILTPLFIAIKVIHHLKRLLGQDVDPSEYAISVWNLVFNQRNLLCHEKECASRSSFFDDYVDVFLSILAEASSLEMVLHWARLDQHHATQCSEAILKACKWRGSEDDIGKDALLKLQTVVGATLEKIRINTRRTNISLPFMPWGVSYSAPCFRLLETQLKHLGNMLEKRLPIEVTTGVLGLYQNIVQAGVAVGEIVSSWSCKQQSLELVENIHSFCKGEDISSLSPAQSEFVWQLLKSFGRLCMNSCEDLLIKFKELIVLHDPEDGYGFNRLPKWRQEMIADGVPARVINDWCVAFLMTPLEDLTSRDVDAIVDLNFRSLKLVASVSQVITQVIFPEDGFEVKQGEGIKKGEIKERIRLARLLGEFVNILRLRKPDENPKDAVVRDIVVDACNELCRSHENRSRKRNDLYKIHGQKLKSLFTEIFGRRRISEDGQVIIQDCGMAPQAGVKELNVTISIARQSSYLHENLPSVLSHRDVYEPMVVLLRRWLSGIVRKPTLASHTLAIVQLLFSVHPSGKKPSFLEQLHSIIQGRVLSLDRNQSLMSQLQAAGYNQDGEDKLDLWTSPTVELPCYLSKRESPSDRLFAKKLTEVLRRLWNEWKDILFMCRVPSIKVGEEEVCTKDLFGVQLSLKEMEEQVAAVKEKIKQVNSEQFISDDLDRRVERLMRLEQQHRKRIEKLYKSANDRRSETSEEMRKFIAVWENRFLEQVKLCSERIPGCYAPNGFHSEKPVICALSVDNRILTVFKEEKGRREEIENVEVKLFEAGLYVYGLHTSGHDYVTDELWAAFYKMLLEKGLVPRIVLSNESPGFDWIKKFVQPATSHPCPWKWELSNGIVPQGEDYFDYYPISAALWPAVHGLREFLTLTAENVYSFQFSDFKDVGIVEGKEKRTKQMAGKAIEQLQHELQLLQGHNEPIRKALAGKLTFAVKETVKSIVDGVQPIVETVKKLIDMDKVAFGLPEVEKTEESREQYAAAVLRACEHAQKSFLNTGQK